MTKYQKEIQAFSKRVASSMYFFYQAAFAITGDDQRAAYILDKALEEAFLHNPDAGTSGGLRDSVLTAIREIALKDSNARNGSDSWEGFTADPSDYLSTLIVREPVFVQRLMVLYYGCALTVREISSLLGCPVEIVRQRLNQRRIVFEKMLSDKKLPSRPFEKLAMRSIRRAMNQNTDGQVDIDLICHDFETEMNNHKQPYHTVRRIVGSVFLVLGLILFVVIFWLAAVLLH